jgi:hypothetical protein
MITFLLVTLIVMLGLGLVSYLSEKRLNTSKGASALSLLPGDIRYESPNGRFRFYLPITTSIVISIILSLILHFLR